jgi:hypothetical protein
MPFQENLEQRRMIGRRSETVLHHDVAGGRYRVAGIVGKSSLMAQQLFHGDVVVPLVLDAVII